MLYFAVFCAIIVFISFGVFAKYNDRPAPASDNRSVFAFGLLSLFCLFEVYCACFGLADTSMVIYQRLGGAIDGDYGSARDNMAFIFLFGFLMFLLYLDNQRHKSNEAIRKRFAELHQEIHELKNDLHSAKDSSNYWKEQAADAQQELLQYHDKEATPCHLPQN